MKLSRELTYLYRHHWKRLVSGSLKVTNGYPPAVTACVDWLMDSHSLSSVEMAAFSIGFFIPVGFCVVSFGCYMLSTIGECWTASNNQHHLESLRSKIPTRNSLLKYLTGTSWGAKVSSLRTFSAAKYEPQA